MRISEIFYSIQGEGELSGVPSVFVRTSGCNLRCVWCDTPYASWNPEGEDMGIDMIVEKVEKHPCHHVVLTGGEPMIAKEMRDLAKRLKGRGKHITIETAGTVPPEGISCDLASISPKLANSTPPESKAHAWTAKHDALRLQPAVIQNWLEKYHTQLKFVVQGESDLVEIDDLLKKLPHLKPEQVLLMPEGIDAKILKEKGLVVANICKSRGFRYCPRLHVELYGNKRGT